MVVNARVVSEVVEVIGDLEVDLDSEEAEEVIIVMMIKMEGEEIVLVEEVVVVVVVLSESLMMVKEMVKVKVLERALAVEMKMEMNDAVLEIKGVLVAIDSVVDVVDLAVGEVVMIEVEEDSVGVEVEEDLVDVEVVTVVGVDSTKIDTLVMTQLTHHLKIKKLNLMTSK